MTTLVITRAPWRTAAGLAVLAGVALLAEPLTGLADTAAAGRLGVSTQASLALGASVVTTTTWLITPLLFAQTTQIAQLLASGNRDDVTNAVRAGLWRSAVLGVAIAALLATAALTVIDDAETRNYVLARAIGLPATAVVMAAYGALRGAGAMRDVTTMALSGAAAHVAIVAATLLSTDLGVLGIGLAAVTSQLMVAAAALSRLHRQGILARPRDPVHGTTARASRSGRDVAFLGARSATLGAATLTMTAAAVSISPDHGAAHAVTYQFWLFTVLAIEGWKSAAQILVASSPSPAEQLRLERTMLRGSAVLGVGAAVVVVALMPIALDVVAADRGVAALASSIWWLSALSMLARAVAYTRDGIEYGRGEFAHNLVRTLAGCLVCVAGAAVTHHTGDLTVLARPDDRSAVLGVVSSHRASSVTISATARDLISEGGLRAPARAIARVISEQRPKIIESLVSVHDVRRGLSVPLPGEARPLHSVIAT